MTSWRHKWRYIAWASNLYRSRLTSHFCLFNSPTVFIIFKNWLGNLFKKYLFRKGHLRLHIDTHILIDKSNKPFKSFIIFIYSLLDRFIIMILTCFLYLKIQKEMDNKFSDTLMRPISTDSGNLHLQPEYLHLYFINTKIEFTAMWYCIFP